MSTSPAPVRRILIAVYLLGLYLARERNALSIAEEQEIVAAMRRLPEQVLQVLENEKEIVWLADRLAGLAKAGRS